MKVLPARPAIADVILGASTPERRARLLAGVLVTLGLHGALWLSTRGRQPPSHPVQPAREISLEIAVAPARLPPNPMGAETRHAEPPAPRAVVRPERAAQARAARPAAPAQAGAIVASEPSSHDPVDLTGDAFVVGAATAYAGGVTAARGTGTRPGVSRAGDQARLLDGGALAPDRSSGVALGDDSWSCPWPREADAERIDEQTVVIRVVVAADGKPASAEVVSDPGHGFAQAAIACAMQTRFAPSRDREGRTIRARSPPIRVRFTR